MELGIDNFKDIIEIAVGIVGASSLAFAAYSYYISKKQLNFAVIVNCTERFQRIFPTLKSKDEEEKLQGIKQYIDLCNEELFYFKHKYLPVEIINEWIDGMIYYLPHFQNGKNLNKHTNLLIEIVERNLLEEYPRIRESFEVNREFDLREKDERKALVELVKANLKKESNHT